MQKITLSQLNQCTKNLQLRVLSINSCLYQAYVLVDDFECVLLDEKQRSIKAASVGLLVEKLKGIPFSKATMVHSSAYDEMIGLTEGEKVKALEVPMDWAGLCNIHGR
ncbi:DUF6482 family protein [Pseudoteredinibacter isoporae]|uniref:Uncharacterized protein n=1 Tax=Pseudoteredinibacter isoporae TaxID=570281 RepID=A0A7X0JPY1_9GAMM|nr:DUF6482 family protein [Pseudoteredinibacter isoporae]MBB6520085.1 hypothetical protein [Pseudoteredinibacter isoporae]NHO85657.1 hypothetical protein [Pseudoteredinibacter isoporae]NIB25891.1 hypothetical protein [Pseudoteredinibacter isoporae]